MRTLLVVGAGGFLGAIARYLLSTGVARTGLPFVWGTFVVNVLGCAALGVLLELAETWPQLPPATRLFVGVGILGSFTTFSTFGGETLEFVRVGAPRLALLNVAGNVIVGLLALWLGRVAVRTLVG
jgi:CrcB protein